MEWFLLIALGILGAVVVALCTLVLFIRHRLVVRNRVQPGVANDAPMLWLVSPQAPARLHRRLVTAAAAARLVAARHRTPGRKGRTAEPLPIVELCEELVVQADGLDRHLTLTARLPASQRRAVLQRLGDGVREVEAAAARLSVMSAELTAPRVLPHHESGVAELTAKLDHLEAADGELRALEAGAGLDWATPFRSPGERAPVLLDPDGWAAPNGTEREAPSSRNA